MRKEDRLIKLTATVRRWTGSVLRPDSALGVSSIRREALPYFAGWILILTWLYVCFLPNGDDFFLESAGFPGYERASIYIWLIVCPLITTFVKASRYVPATVFSAAAALVCFIGTTFFSAGPTFLLIARTVIAAAVGHIFASCGYGFFMILNNAEKFFSMIVGIFLPKLIMLIFPFLAGNLRGISFSGFILLCCLLGTLFCSVFFFRERALIPEVGSRPFPRQAWSIMAMVFLILAFNDVIVPLLLLRMKIAQNRPLEIWYFGGIVAGLLLVLLLQKYLRLNICLMLNLSLAFMAVGFVLSMPEETSDILPGVCAADFGLAYAIGMVNIYYLAGFMSKKFQNITFYRTGIVLSAVYYFLGFFTFRLFEKALPVMVVGAVCILIAFFALSPVFVKLLYSGGWIDDSYRPDVTFESRLRARLRELNLSPKETEVCELLLRGYTLRQTAAMLEIAYSTANTYCTSLYRKLGINSRTELTLLFKEYIEA